MSRDPQDISVIRQVILVIWRDPYNNDIQVYINPNATIFELKCEIGKLVKVNKSGSRLIFAGKQLNDDKRLTEYSIRDGSTVHEVLRLSCGCKIFPNGNKECQLIVKLKDMGFEQPSIPQLLNTYNGNLNKVINAILG